MAFRTFTPAPLTPTTEAPAVLSRSRETLCWALLGLTLTLGASWVLHAHGSAWLVQHQARMAALQEQASLGRAALAAGEGWQKRRQEAQAVQAFWTHWRRQQAQAWQAMQVLLSVPPQGVQLDKAVWRDQQWQLTGRSLSLGHWQAWQTRLAQVGLSPQAERGQWHAAQWRALGIQGAKQHAFELPLVQTQSPLVEP